MGLDIIDATTHHTKRIQELWQHWGRVSTLKLPLTATFFLRSSFWTPSKALAPGRDASRLVLPTACFNYTPVTYLSKGYITNLSTRDC